jgi:RHS repeat-associated protein
VYKRQLYAYDDEGQLLSESRPGYATAYTYDGNGNRKTRTVNSVLEEYAYDSGDKLLSVVSGGNTRSFEYDLAGRCTVEKLNTVEQRAFAWTAGSRLASINASTGSEGYTYSVFGTRAKVGTRTFLRAGAGVTAGVLADGNADYTPGISEVRSGTTTYSHSGLKHMAAQSGSGASVSATREYDAFGGVASSSGSWHGPFGAAGAFGYQTEASGLHLLGHRYYDPSLGRFLTRDPVGDGSNWYAYCANDPVGLADPQGLMFVAAAMEAFTRPHRLRMFVALPGQGPYPLGHAWIEILNPDGSLDRYEHGPGGNTHVRYTFPDSYYDAWSSGYYYREVLVNRDDLKRPKPGWWYGYVVNNCVTFAERVWHDNGGDRPKRTIVDCIIISPPKNQPVPALLVDRYDDWRRR